MRMGNRGRILAAGLLAGSSVSAVFTCEVNLDGAQYDLRGLKGNHMVTVSRDTPPSTTNTTWYVNPCGKIDLENSKCPQGSQVCGIQTVYLPDNDKGVITEIIPVAGDFGDRSSGVSTSKRDKGDGVRVDLTDGVWGKNEHLKASIEFVCDKDKGVGNLEFVQWDGQTAAFKWVSSAACKLTSRDDDKPKDGDDKPKDDKPKEDKPKEDKPKDDKKPEEGKEPQDESASWGFFTWSFILFVLAVAFYVIGSAWVNYNRYGLSGVDMLPHSSTVRELPYLLRDLVNKIIGTFAGSSRGGYSAV
ncbi:autophagy-related protein 27 [Trichomonascus vanleenenianus]|uniref:Atg27p n=1 Tax=Trichomonascus vanleenenianus TaxID=2268995 RepID=UPI003ECB0B3D